MIDLNELRNSKKLIKDGTVSLRVNSENLKKFSEIARSYEIARADIFTALIESFLKEYEEKEILND